MRTRAHVWKNSLILQRRRGWRGRNRTGARMIEWALLTYMTPRDPSVAAGTPEYINLSPGSSRHHHSLLLSPFRLHTLRSFPPFVSTAHTSPKTDREMRTRGRARARARSRKKRRYYVWHKSWHMRFLTNLSTVIYTRGGDAAVRPGCIIIRRYARRRRWRSSKRRRRDERISLTRLFPKLPSPPHTSVARYITLESRGEGKGHS